MKKNSLIFIVKSREEKNLMGNHKGYVFEAHVYIYKVYHCLSLKQFSHITWDASSPFTVPAVILGDSFIQHIAVESVGLLQSYFCECIIMPFKLCLEFTVVLLQAFRDVLP